MSCRFWVTSPTTTAPAVSARPRISSHGSWVSQGRAGRATLTRTARSWRNDGPLLADGQLVTGLVKRCGDGGCSMGVPDGHRDGTAGDRRWYRKLYAGEA